MCGSSRQGEARAAWNGECHRQHVLSSEKGESMSTLIAIGYPDESTASAAADEARRLSVDLNLQRALHGEASPVVL